MLAAGIRDIRSAAEDQYYTLELCLTPAQLPIFLAQLSGSEEVSDNHLQSLIGAVGGNRRESFMQALISPDECIKLFKTRLGLIAAFLDHDPSSQDTAAWHEQRRRAGSRQTQLVRHHRCPRLPHRTQTGRRWC